MSLDGCEVAALDGGEQPVGHGVYAVMDSSWCVDLKFG